MASVRLHKSFYRVAHTFPPGDDEYKSARELGRKLPADASEEHRRSWEGLSVYDTEEGARRQALKFRGRLGRLIVRFDIPTGAGITWRPSFGPGHYDLFGDPEELKRYLSDVVVPV